MRRTTRLAAVSALVSLTVALGACAETPTPGPETGTATSTPPPASGLPAPGEGEGAAGATKIGEIYGPACDQVPLQGEGSALSMANEPVGTAASNNPLLKALAQAVGAANLLDTLNDRNASYTVFAPADVAFESLPPGTLNQLMANPAQLRDILTYHVVAQRYDAKGLAAAGKVTTVEGKELTITGEPGSLLIGEQQRAKVLCGNIPTANATVFVIDRVLMPPA